MIAAMADYIGRNYIQILEQLLTHLGISLLALLTACIIGIPLGYFASRSTNSERLLSIPFQVLRVVPSLALLVLLIPVMGTGVAPAVTALTVLAVPPIFLNTIVGFREVPEFMVESGVGIGMTEQQVLRQVRIPLALPMILSGVRTGMVEAIASAALAAKIGAGGLGELIFTGLGLNRADLLLIGGVLVAVLSVGCGVLFDWMTRKLLKYKY
ncbi:MAG: ABC transporter permease [Lachnospiraceae bacterium]|nr:ABC transporter permease [Lachnospiraceae bacterium]